MKKFLAILIFIFTFPFLSQADDIEDFEIEGITLGGSLLDYISEEKIKDNVAYVYPNKEFTIMKYIQSTKVYDGGIGITYKSNDKKYKIHGVQGRIGFSNIEDCYKKQDEVDKEITSFFNKPKKKDWGILKLTLQGAATDKSTYRPITFDVNKANLQIACYYYHEDPPHYLKVSMMTEELSEFLSE